jgi:hypothetical protein
MGDGVAFINVKGNIGHTDLDDIANPSLQHLGVVNYVVNYIEKIQRYLKNTGVLLSSKPWTTSRGTLLGIG